MSKKPVLSRDFLTLWEKQNPAESESAKFILDAFSENSKKYHKQYIKAYYLIIVLLAIFYLLNAKIATPNKPIEILGIEIPNAAYILWGVGLLVSFLYYQAITAFFQERNCTNALRQYLSTHALDVSKLKLVELIVGQSFIGFEMFQANKFNSQPAYAFLTIIYFVLLFIPSFILLFIVYQNLLLWSSINSLVFKSVILLLIIIFLTRSIWVIIEEMKNP